MIMSNFFSHPNSIAHSKHAAAAAVSKSKRMSVVDEEGIITTTMPLLLYGQPRSRLSSRGSADSMSSWTSASTTETTESDSVVSLNTRRQIFSEYWKTNTPVIPDHDEAEEDQEEEEDDDRPGSPLLQHYPTRKESSGSSPASIMEQQELSSSDTKQQQQVFSVSPSRRSIFGRTKSNSLSTTYSDRQDNKNNIDLNRFFSKHEHMTVLSSSLDSMSCGTTTLLKRRRPRRYSCSDSSTSQEPKGRQPLASCLKRRNTGDCHSATSSSGIISLDELQHQEPPQQHEPAPQATTTRRRPLVTFDSQIEIVAFEPATSYEEAPSCVDGSWTDIFER